MRADDYAPGFQRLLGDSVARHCFCTLLDDAPHLIFIGRPDHLTVALELYFWIKAQLQLRALADECDAHRAGTWRRGHRSAFLAGAATRVEQRLNAAPIEATALVRLTDAENRRYMKRHFGRIRYRAPRAPYHEAAHDAGRAAADAITLERRPAIHAQRALARGA